MNYLFKMAGSLRWPGEPTLYTRACTLANRRRRTIGEQKSDPVALQNAQRPAIFLFLFLILRVCERVKLPDDAERSRNALPIRILRAIQGCCRGLRIHVKNVAAAPTR